MEPFTQVLRKKNVLRCETAFKHNINEWSVLEWAAAVAGEIGEAAQILNDLESLRFKTFFIKSRLKDELADIIIYMDLLLASLEEPPIVFMDEYSRNYADFYTDPPEWKINFCLEGLLLLNLAKKVRRGDGSVLLIKDMCYQIISYVVDIAHMAVIDLDVAIAEKFNEVSERVGSDITIDWKRTKK